MGFNWDPDNDKGSIKKGIDFCLYFNGTGFTVRDIQSRYNVTYRQAHRILDQARLILDIKPAGFSGPYGTMNVWKFNL